jgi:hypothetical protein
MVIKVFFFIVEKGKKGKRVFFQLFKNGGWPGLEK